MAKEPLSVSPSVIRRLPRYYRFLERLKQNGLPRISSEELAAKMGLTASQIRQDLNCFGGFGRQGYGYNVSLLSAEIERILALDKTLLAILVGVGNLGRALVSYLDDARGISLIGLFDKDPTLVSDVTPTLPVMEIHALEAFCAQHNPAVAILCIPAESALPIAERLVHAGVRGFWNFSHAELDLHLGPDICVENVHLEDSLMALGFHVHARKVGAKNQKSSREAHRMFPAKRG